MPDHFLASRKPITVSPSSNNIMTLLQQLLRTRSIPMIPVQTLMNQIQQLSRVPPACTTRSRIPRLRMPTLGRVEKVQCVPRERLGFHHCEDHGCRLPDIGLGADGAVVGRAQWVILVHGSGPCHVEVFWIRREECGDYVDEVVYFVPEFL